jgi:hypothetical protein
MVAWGGAWGAVAEARQFFPLLELALPEIERPDEGNERKEKSCHLPPSSTLDFRIANDHR